MGMTTDVRQLSKWTPLRLYWQESSAFVDWCYVGEQRLTDPFYDQTVERSLRNPCNLLFRHQTPIETLGQLQEAEPCLPPRGFIFHTSRCGSTLISQMLASLRAFPGVPRIFLYREPAEVMVSQLRRRGAHMIPGAIEPALFDMDMADVFRMPQEEYVARVLAKICGEALRHLDDEALLLNYRQLPEAVWSALPGFFGVDYAEPDLERMRRASRLDAKNPSLAFADDTAEKARGVTDAVRRACEQLVEPLYQKLEAARTARRHRRSA
ncbi:MAG: hypothetical protein LC754_14995 [Acidobacteria bacterium]|nr:hypothetical protein [Acidobacteriota bacterium]